MNFNLALSCKSICVNVKLFIKIISCHSISIETFLQSIEKEIRKSVSKRSFVYPQNVFGIGFYFLTRPRILKSSINVVINVFISKRIKRVNSDWCYKIVTLLMVKRGLIFLKKNSIFYFWVWTHNSDQH